jgi:hypothetical protein
MNNNQIMTQLVNLPTMATPDLVTLWTSIFEVPPHNKNKVFLIRKIAWRLQELAYGGLSDDTQTKIRNMHDLTTKKTIKKNLPPIGTILEREHGNETHRVTVLRDGFEYRQCKYKSLTKIATHITGTKWSGPRFFGLKS